MTSVYSTRWYDRYAKGEGKVDWERSQVGLIKGKTGPSDSSSKRSDLTDLTVWTTGPLDHAEANLLSITSIFLNVVIK